MTYTACIHPLDGYLRMTTSGDLGSPEETMEYFTLVGRMAREYSLTRILLDETRLTLLADLMNAYAFANTDMAQEMVESGFRLACLARPDQYQFLHSVETIMLNRSLSYRVFLDEDEAVAWLTR